MGLGIGPVGMENEDEERVILNVVISGQMRAQDEECVSATTLQLANMQVGDRHEEKRVKLNK